MTELEDGIRRALRARASEIQPPLPSLKLGPRHAPVRVARIAGYRFWTSAQLHWLAPAAAVVVVLALVAGGLLARAELARTTTPAAQIQTGGGQIQTTVPPYYVALANESPVTTGQPTRTVATVRDTVNGALVASVTPPAPYAMFTKVFGATDDRTFVLLATGRPNGLNPQRFFLLRIHPLARSVADRTQLTALPATDISGGKQVSAMALSPNGDNLAAILDNPNSSQVYLYVYNLVTGTTRVWVRKPCSDCRQIALGGPDYPVAGAVGSLSWTLSSRSLAFTEAVGSRGSFELRLLDLSGPGDNVQPDSAPFAIHGIPPFAIHIVPQWNYAVMTPDGKTVFVSYETGRGGSLWFWLARFSAVTDKLTTINKLPVWKAGHPRPDYYGFDHAGGVDEVLWTSYDGNLAVVLNASHGQSAGIYAGTHYTPIPWPTRNAIGAAW
jgi:hypothetical protein